MAKLERSGAQPSDRAASFERHSPFSCTSFGHRSSINLKTISKKESNIHIKRIIYENLSVSYDSIRDYKNAYYFLRESYDLKFKLTNEQLAENIAEVEARYNLAVEEQKTEEEKKEIKERMAKRKKEKEQRKRQQDLNVRKKEKEKEANKSKSLEGMKKKCQGKMISTKAFFTL